MVVFQFLLQVLLQDQYSRLFSSAGGGGGGGESGGAGGAGGFRESSIQLATVILQVPLASPSGLPVSVTTYPITVGGGGATGSQTIILETTAGVKFSFFNNYISRWWRRWSRIVIILG
jgi:hypothetical protein